MVIQFYAPWCEACTMIGRQYRKVAKDRQYSHISFATVNVDQAVELTEAKKVESVPTFLFVADGKVKARVVGVKNPDTFAEFLRKKIDKKMPAQTKSRYGKAVDSTKGFLRKSVDWIWNTSKNMMNNIKGWFVK